MEARDAAKGVMESYSWNSRMKRIYTLRPLMTQVFVRSLANGTILIEPRWRKDLDGVRMSREAAASRMEYLLNCYLKRRKLP